MPEQEAAVAWLEQDYDRDLELVTEKFDDELWGDAVYFFARGRKEYARGMFSIKAQNG